jgi:hypothetical protein
MDTDENSWKCWIKGVNEIDYYGWKYKFCLCHIRWVGGGGAWAFYFLGKSYILFG